jgi:hypothetical protein
MNALAKKPVTTMSHTTSLVMALKPCVKVNVFVASATVSAPNAHAPTGIGFNTNPVTVLTKMLNKFHAWSSKASGHPTANFSKRPTPIAIIAFVTFKSSASSTGTLVSVVSSLASLASPPSSPAAAHTRDNRPNPRPLTARARTALSPRAPVRAPHARTDDARTNPRHSSLAPALALAPARDARAR